MMVTLSTLALTIRYSHRRIERPIRRLKALILAIVLEQAFVATSTLPHSARENYSPEEVTDGPYKHIL